MSVVGVLSGLVSVSSDGMMSLGGRPVVFFPAARSHGWRAEESEEFEGRWNHQLADGYQRYQVSYVISKREDY